MMKKMIICLAVCLTANGAFSQKDSAFKNLKLGMDLTAALQTEKNLRLQAIDSIKKSSEELQRINWLLASAADYLEKEKISEPAKANFVAGIKAITYSRLRKICTMLDGQKALDLALQSADRTGENMLKEYADKAAGEFKYDNRREKKEIKLICGEMKDIYAQISAMISENLALSRQYYALAKDFSEKLSASLMAADAFFYQIK